MVQATCFPGHTIHVLKRHAEKSNKGEKKIPNHLASASGQAFFPSNCITNSLPLEKQSLSYLRLFTLILRKTNCPISALLEEVLRFSLTLLDCPPKFFQAPSPWVLQICRNPVRKRKNPAWVFLFGKSSAP